MKKLVFYCTIIFATLIGIPILLYNILITNTGYGYNGAVSFMIIYIIIFIIFMVLSIMEINKKDD